MTGKTLLLTGFPPDSRSGGAVIVRSLAERFSPGTLDWISFCEPASTGSQPRQFIGALPAPPSWGNARLGLAPFWWWWGALFSDRRVTARLSRLIKQDEYRTVWMVLDHPRAGIAAALVRACPNVRFHFSVHDNPRYSAIREGMPQRLVNQTERHLEFLGKKTCSVDAVTEEMLAELGWNTPFRAIVTAGIDPIRAERRIRAPSSEGVLRVSCIGNYVGVAAVTSAAAGLELWSATSGRAWRLDLYGRNEEALKREGVFTHPYTDLEAAREEILKSDLFLLPLGFEANEIEQMRTCLPTKLVTYLEFARLIITFTPAGSATERIVREYCLGPVVNGLEPQSAARAVDEALAWDLEAANRGRDQLIAGRFAQDRIFARFSGALDRLASP